MIGADLEPVPAICILASIETIFVLPLIGTWRQDTCLEGETWQAPD
jgi:hypothetical protein